MRPGVGRPGVGCGGGALALVLTLAAGSPAWAAGPVGQLSVDCTGLEGWAQEPDLPEALIDVHLYFDAPAGDPAATGVVVVTADQTLDQGCAGSECMHGYRSALPMSRLDGVEHPVHAYGIDQTGDPNLELGNSPAVLDCPPPPIVGGERRHVVSPEILAAWQLSIFFDRLVIPDPTIEGLSEGPVIDAAPQLALEEPSGDLWLLDGEFRRSVSPEAAAAWRFDPAGALPMSAAELAARPEGTPLRPRPVLVQGSGPAVYMLDDHQCVDGDPDPACEPEPEGTTDEGGVPPAEDSTGPGDSGRDSGDGGSSGGEGASTGLATTGVPPAQGEDEGGCGCRGGGRGGGGGGGAAALLGLWALVARRRRLRRSIDAPRPGVVPSDR